MNIVNSEPPSTAEAASSPTLRTVKGKDESSTQSPQSNDRPINQPSIAPPQVGQHVTRLLTTATFNRSFTQLVSLILGVLTLFLPSLGSFDTFMMSQSIVRFALWFISIASLNVNTEISTYHMQIVALFDRLFGHSIADWLNRRPNLIGFMNAIRFTFLDYCTFLFVYTVTQAMAFTVRKQIG